MDYWVEDVEGSPGRRTTLVTERRTKPRAVLLERRNRFYRVALIRRQTVVLDDDHVADAEIFRGKLQLVALLEHFKELIRPSSSEFLMESF